MNVLGVILYDGLAFPVEVARFGYVRTSDWGPGWNFLIGGFSTATERGRDVYPHGLMLFAEAAPLALDPATLCGQELEYARGYYEQAAWGASWFECWIDGHNETWDVKLEFPQQLDNRYQVLLSATVGDDYYRPLYLSVWAELHPTQERPTGFSLAPRAKQQKTLQFVEENNWRRYY